MARFLLFKNLIFYEKSDESKFHENNSALNYLMCYSKEYFGI